MARKTYSTIVRALTTAQKTAIASLVMMGHMPSEACRRLHIPTISYTDAYKKDAVFRNDIDSAKAGLAVELQDTIYSAALRGDMKKAELWLANYNRSADEKDPFKWVTTTQAEVKEDDVGKSYSEYLNKLFDEQFKRLRGGKPGKTWEDHSGEMRADGSISGDEI